MINGTEFKTKDLYLATYLKYRGIEPVIVKDGARAVFMFQVSDELYKLMTAFNMNDAVPIQDYIDIFKEMRSKMHDIKG